MTESTCAHCGTEYDRCNGRQTYCSVSCRAKAKYRRKYPLATLDAGCCVQCGDMFSPKGLSALYCSGQCRNRAKYERGLASGREAATIAKTKARYNSDPGFRQRSRDKQTRLARARGVKPMFRRDPVCTIPTCERLHLAKGLCKKHYSARQKRLKPTPTRATVLLDCIASLYGMAQPKVKTVDVWILDNGGATVWCPRCGSTMAFALPEFRFCPMCATTVVLNPEELAWVISETLSTRPSTQAA